MAKWGEINCPRCAELEAKLAAERGRIADMERRLKLWVPQNIAETGRLPIREGNNVLCVSCGAPTPNDFCGFCLEEE